MNRLGEVLHERCSEAQALLYDLQRKAAELAEALAVDYPEAAAILRNEDTQPHPVWRLAEALTFLQGRKNTQQNFIGLWDSACFADRPNGLGVRRVVTRTIAGVGQRKRTVRSLVLSDAVLDDLVHLHTLAAGDSKRSRPLSLQDFLLLLRERYGFFVDAAPPGLAVSNESLRANRAALERRLRDLGLLVGVNDAEAMKLLRPRFEPEEL